jgi:hypothetical protein
MNKISLLVSSLINAAKYSQRSILSVLLEMMRLRFSIGKIGISEYFDCRLYENYLSLEEKQAFCGYRGQNILEEILVDDKSEILALDKVTMYLLLKSYGFPIPELRAVYGSGKRTGPFHCINSIESLGSYFKERDSLPVYLKPSFGVRGKGNTLVQSMIDDILLLGDGTRVSVDEFCKSLKTESNFGWILQKPLQAHSAIAELCGSKVSGIRVHTFLSRTGPKVIRAIWKINTGTTDTDNFARGTSGNMLAEIELETGLVKRIVSGLGLEQETNPIHPVTGKALLGFYIPHWEATKNLVLDASAAFDGYICPGWDIAICEDGPKILEVNFFGDVGISQYAYNRGFLDEEFIGLLRELELCHLLQGGSKYWQRQKSNGRFGRRKAHWKW